MTAIEADIPCPRCRKSSKVPLSEIGPGKSRSCPACGAQIVFSGQDGSGIQRALDQLGSTLGGANIKVTAKTKTRRSWWKLW